MQFVFESQDPQALRLREVTEQRPSFVNWQRRRNVGRRSAAFDTGTTPG